LLQASDLNNDPNTIGKRSAQSCVSFGALVGGALVLLQTNPVSGLVAGVGASAYAAVSRDAIKAKLPNTDRCQICLAYINEAAVRKISGYSAPLTRNALARKNGLIGFMLPAIQNIAKGKPRRKGKQQAGR
jgi:hypothetical protein